MVSIPDWSVTPHGAGFDRAEVAASIDRFNEAARSVCTAAGIEWFDVTGISRAAGGAPALIAGDGLHFSGDMYRRWSHRLAPLAERLTGISL
jgi:lysophospholipase L1-like esterase